jgi:RimJ/RimL family protein N-acetyltransferase
MFENDRDHHFIILLRKKPIGHIALAYQGDWYELNIVIGEKRFWGKGYGTEAIRQILKKAKRLRISKIFLEVRPTNQRAIHSYLNSGFKKARVIKYPKNPNLPETVRMEWVIDSTT